MVPVQRTAYARIVRAAASVLCVLFLLKDVGALDTGEFSGGELSGRMIRFSFWGLLALIASVALAFRSGRLSASVAAVGASVVIVPLLYFRFPAVFSLGVLSSDVPPTGYMAAGSFWLLAVLVSVVLILAGLEVLGRRGPSGA